MPINKSAIKNQRKDEERKIRNKVLKSRVHTAFIKVNQALNTKNNEEINKRFNEYSSAVDKAAKRKVFHTNKSARLKSNMVKRIRDFLSGKHHHSHSKAGKKKAEAK